MFFASAAAIRYYITSKYLRGYFSFFLNKEKGGKVTREFWGYI